jgi:hypothetical protein
MSRRDRLYLFGPCCLGPAIFNALINGGIGWAATRKVAGLGLWTLPGVAADIAGTAFGVAFGTYLGMAFQVRRDLKAGKVGLMGAPAIVAAVFDRLASQGTFGRGVSFGLAAVPIFALPMLAALAIGGGGSMTSRSFTIFKAAFAALEAAVISPPMVLGLLAEMKARSEAAALEVGAVTPLEPSA